jgi:hypothetical protein
MLSILLLSAALFFSSICYYSSFRPTVLLLARLSLPNLFIFYINFKLIVLLYSLPYLYRHVTTTFHHNLQVAGSLSQDEIAALSHRIQFGGDEVVKAKDGAGSATLSMAYSGARFAGRLLSAMAGEKDVIECTYVENSLTDADFFATPCRLGPGGVEEVLLFGAISAFEQAVSECLSALL